MLKVECEKFGWPALKNETGPFWTHTLDKVILRNIMDYLDQIKDPEWDITRRTHSEELMFMDPGNLKIKTLLESIL
jgi:surface carbohydrate biosynthesis protein